MGTPISAKSGKLEIDAGEIADIRNISFVEENDAQVYSSSSTSGRKKRIAGVSDATGSFTLYPDAGAVALSFSVGDSVTVKGYTDGSAKYFEVAAVITNITLGVPIEEGGLVPFDVEFGGDGAPSKV